MGERLDKVGATLRQESKERSRSLEETEARLQQAARSTREEIDVLIAQLETQASATDERTSESLKQLNSLLAKRASEADQALARNAEELRAEKVGREDLAGMLGELALRLRGEFDLP